MIVDLFAGPGGWSEGLRMLSPELHATEIGLEWDAAACATRAAAGHRTIRCDVSAYPVEPFAGKVTGLIASPPCQDFSVAGKGAGRDGDRGRHVDEVIRWAEALRPEWIVCEEVPPVLPIWEDFATVFRSWGYSAWCGVLNAADYGVPQTRQRAFLIASRTRPALPPEPTHAKAPEPSLFGPELEPWVSMADALGWRPGRTLDRRQSGAPILLCDEVPAPTVVGAALAKDVWKLGDVVLRSGQTVAGGPHATRTLDEPAVTIIGRADLNSWCWERPATTVAGDPRITARCHHDDGSQGANAKSTEQVRAGDYEGTEPVKLTPAEALVLQSFPANYPVQGTKTKSFEQIGNAVPPLLAMHVLKAVAA